MSDSTFPWEMKLLLAGAFLLIGTALALLIVPPLVRVWHEWRWRQFRARHGGSLLEALERERMRQ